MSLKIYCALMYSTKNEEKAASGSGSYVDLTKMYKHS